VELLDKRLEGAKARNDQRLQAALERHRERFLERLDEISLLEAGRDYRSELGSDTKLEIAGAPGNRAGAVTDMKTANALAKLKEYRNKLYFSGNSSQALSTLEKVIGKLSQQERSHIGPTLTRRLLRLGETLDRAEQRAGAVPRPQTPQTPQGAPQGPRPPSSTGRPPPAGARSQSDPGPTTRMLAAYQRYYEGMSPDEAEVDLRAEMAQDPSLTARGIPSPRTLAKQQAYSRLYPNRPLTMRIPDVPPPGAAPQPVTPRPGATRTGPRAPDAAGSATAHAPEPGGAAVGAVLR
jgi:hypothetical protein